MRNPVRRNRNIGTAKSGRGKSGRFEIPRRWKDLTPYWEWVPDAVTVPARVHGNQITFIVQPPRKDFLQRCTVQDVLHMLEVLPPEDTCYIKLVVLRQPTKKQVRPDPKWGSLGYWSEIGQLDGPGIYLEAQPSPVRFKWGNSLWPEAKLELRRLEQAGFVIKRHSRGYDFEGNASAIRSRQLYVTVPHKLGHYVDYLECQRAFEWGDDWDRFWELYQAKPRREREFRANRYADESWKRGRAESLLPFHSHWDEYTILEDGSDPAWFAQTRPAT